MKVSAWLAFGPSVRWLLAQVGGKQYKQHKRGAGRHVQLPKWVQACEAWATLKLGPRALYIELKPRYNGHNNGQIFLSQRDAAKALNVQRNTIGPWFSALEQRGFILMTKGPFLGQSGVGIAAQWALTEIAFNGAGKAQNDFKKWRIPAQKQGIDVPKTVHGKKAA